MKQSIGIVGGTGKQGSALAKRLAVNGYEVRIGSRSKEKGERIARELSQELDSVNISGGENIYAIESEIVFLAIPFDQVEQLIVPYKDILKNKIIVDLTNYLQFGELITAKFKDTKSCYENICDMLPDSKIVTSLKTISFLHLEGKDPINQADFQITEYDEAFDITKKIAKDLTLQPIRVKGIDHAKTIEGMVALIIQLDRTHKKSHPGYYIKNL